MRTGRWKTWMTSSGPGPPRAELVCLTTIIAADTSPLITLARTGVAHLLPALFETIIVPESVWRELAGPAGTAESATIGALVGLRLVPDRLPHPDVEGLGRGETQAILHARFLGCPVLLDERTARRRAQGLGLVVFGSLRVLIEGKARGHLALVGPVIEAMQASGYRLGEEVVRRTLAEAGEGP